MNRPIFVLSTGRCGTLSLQRFLRKSARVEAFHRYRGRRSEFWNDMSFVLEQNYAYYRALRQGDGRAARFCTRMLQRSRAYLIRRVDGRGKRFVELNHEFAPYGPLLDAAFPSAKFVHLFRDPRSVVTSFMQKLDPQPMTLPAYMGTRYSPVGQYVLRYGYIRSLSDRGPKVLREFVESHRFDTQLHPFEKVNGKWREQYRMSPFEKTCWYWNAVNRVVMDLLDRVNDERKLSIQFEDFFRPESRDSRNRFLDFFGIDDVTESAMATSFEEKVNVKQVRTSFPSPDQWGEDMVHTLNEFCRETMTLLGY